MYFPKPLTSTVPPYPPQQQPMAVAPDFFCPPATFYNSLST